MFNFTVKPGGALERLRTLPERTAKNFRERIGTEVSPEVQQAVVNAMGEAPPTVSSPFEFGGVLSGIGGYDPRNKSRRFYFAMLQQNPTLSDGEHWVREGDVENSFSTFVSYGATSGKVTVKSSNYAAKFVYGPWQVAGHRNTGWQKQFDVAQQIVKIAARRAVVELWRDAWVQEIEGRA